MLRDTLIGSPTSNTLSLYLEVPMGPLDICSPAMRPGTWHNRSRRLQSMLSPLAKTFHPSWLLTGLLHHIWLPYPEETGIDIISSSFQLYSNKWTTWSGLTEKKCWEALFYSNVGHSRMNCWKPLVFLSLSEVNKTYKMEVLRCFVSLPSFLLFPTDLTLQLPRFVVWTCIQALYSSLCRHTL